MYMYCVRVPYHAFLIFSFFNQLKFLCVSVKCTGSLNILLKGECLVVYYSSFITLILEYNTVLMLHNGTEQVTVNVFSWLSCTTEQYRGGAEHNESDCLCCHSSQANAPSYVQAAFTHNVKWILSSLWMLECYCSLCLWATNYQWMTDPQWAVTVTYFFTALYFLLPSLYIHGVIQHTFFPSACACPFVLHSCCLQASLHVVKCKWTGESNLCSLIIEGLWPTEVFRED